MPQIDNQQAHLTLMGRPAWRCGEHSGWLGGKHAALVGYVAVVGPVPRDVLSQLLWPGDAALANDSLRHHVQRLRSVSGHRLLEQGAAVALARGVHCDLHEPLASRSLAELLAGGDFLAGLDMPPLRRFMGWLGEQRALRRAAVADALSEHATRCAEEGRFAEGLAAVDQALLRSPASEAAWRARMRLRYQMGERDAALRAYADFEHLLRSRPGAAPDAQTVDVLRLIESADGVRTASRAAVLDSLQRPPRLVGRDAAWVAMDDAWAAARPFLLRGEAGIGKSRLLNDYLAGRAGVALAECRPGDSHSPYAVLTVLLRRVTESFPADAADAVRDELGRLMPEFGRAAADIDANEHRLWRAVESLLGATLAQGLRVVAIDDLQFADLASVQALRWLAGGTALRGLRFAFAVRPMADGPLRHLLRDWLTDSRRPEPVEIEAWSADDLALLLDSLVLPATAVLPSPRRLFQRAGGHPFFTLEILKAVLLQKEVEVPAAALPLLELRLQSVPPRAQPMLELAAVMNTELTPRRAALALGEDAATVVVWLSDLQAAGILRGDAFAHDLLRNAALTRLQPAQHAHWHARAAAALEQEPGVAPARVGEHHAAAGQWLDAARCFMTAARAARDSGRLEEQLDLLDRAASASASAADRLGEFDALQAALEVTLARFGPGRANACLPRLRELATTLDQRARLAIAEADLRVHRFDDRSALSAASAALALAEGQDHLLADAWTVYGMALAQSARFDDAVAAHDKAAIAAERAGQERQRRHVANNLVYVQYEAGRVGDAIVAAGDAIARAELAGDIAVAGQTQGNLAMLLLLAGNPAASIAPARQARLRHREIGSGADSVLAGMTLVALGSALSFCGQFGEALDVLGEAAQSLGEASPVPVRAKANLALAHLWLLLGCSDEARAAIPAHADDWPPPMRVQWHWTCARIAAMEGLEPGPHLASMGRIQADHWNAPLMQSAWLEWSQQGDAAAVAAQMQRVRALYLAGGMAGTARTAALRSVDRLLEVQTPAAAAEAAALAQDVRAGIGDGLHACTYMPAAWAILARAALRNADARDHDACLDAARHWVLNVALPHVPAALKPRFLAVNPVNRALFDANG